MPDAHRSQVDQIVALFQQLNWRGRHRLARRLEKFGMTVPQYLVLAMIQKHGPNVTMSEISDVLQLPRSSMTSITDRLVEQDYVARGTLPHDRRAVVASITDRGADLVANVEATNRSELGRYLQGLSGDELSNFRRTLASLLEGIERAEAKDAGLT